MKERGLQQFETSSTAIPPDVLLVGVQVGKGVFAEAGAGETLGDEGLGRIGGGQNNTRFDIGQTIENNTTNERRSLWKWGIWK